MSIQKPIEIIKLLLQSRGADDILAEELIDALESAGWYFCFRAR